MNEQELAQRAITRDCTDAIKAMTKALKGSTFERIKASEPLVNAYFKGIDGQEPKAEAMHRSPSFIEREEFFKRLNLSHIMTEVLKHTEMYAPSIRHYGELFGIEETHHCECGNGKAYLYSSQVRAGDEGESAFYECTNCHKVVREN